MKNDSICLFVFFISIGNLFVKIVFCGLCCLYRPAACKRINSKLFIHWSEPLNGVIYRLCVLVGERGHITEAIVLKYITDNSV